MLLSRRSPPSGCRPCFSSPRGTPGGGISGCLVHGGAGITGVAVFDDFVGRVVAGEGVVGAVDQRHDFASDAGHEVVFGAGAGDD